ncbi:MAG: glycogen debranching protein GlgX [Salinisphaera sp.]|jgi:isoamylase|nr:glycogen debranching protein GlgX [Salinisphaera sp.]
MPNDLAPGLPWPLGAHRIDNGVNFALFSAHAERVELCLFDESGQTEIARHDLPAYTDQVWHGLLPDAGPGLLYGYRVHGPFAPEQGHRFNPNKLLLDPYARDLAGDFQWNDAHYGYPVKTEDADLDFDERDNAAFLPKCRVVDDNFNWQGDQRPAIADADSVIYELHVKGFTQLHPDVPEDKRGTYAGLAEPVVIDYLKELGVTAVELLPVHYFVDEPELAARGLHNYWGYNSIGFFAPMDRYGAGGPAQFKTMVRALHAAGIEVILDVVYNHTAEGDQFGPTLSFRGIDNLSYYHLHPQEPRYYLNHSGCGNALDASHPRVTQMIMDSLRYWASEMRVDGFRFDLATTLTRGGRGFDARAPFLNAVRQEPLLAGLKLIAEPWDVGMGGYQVGQFPPGWSEWNDQFRDTSRQFWLHQNAGPAEFAPVLAGSGDLFWHDGRAPQASVNAVTTHDGYTLHDLVTYADKHNDANGHGNTDGHDHNLSINAGVEGETDDPQINDLRSRLKRNLLATIVFSLGMPMVLAGDEMGHSQGGNNNAYCQDNETTWLDWSNADTGLQAFTRRLIALRRKHPALRSARWFTGDDNGGGARDVIWYNRHGTERTVDEWETPGNQCLGMLLKPVPEAATLLILFNAETDCVDYAMPNGRWIALIDTANPSAFEENADDVGTIEDQHYNLAARSLALFRLVADN